MNYKEKIILVISAHPDDETIGCGGTIAKHINQGDIVYVLSFTNGIGARVNNIDDENLSQERKQASDLAAKIIGFTWIGRGQFPDNMLDTVPLLELARYIEEVKKHISPDIIYTHSSADLNIDHRRVHEATLVAFRAQPNESWQEIRAYEIASSTEWGVRTFNPNLFVNIDKFMHKKVEALNCYWMEMRDIPHPRSISSIENINRVRGSQAGFNYSEAFEIIKSRSL
ncbi:PIG-L deacetylase family protein [Aeromonas veronii]|uniref:PIG-L deacetylase family protein n=1 Tax=Aeromonas veronii TaxID=654 RepID=UPI001CD4968F|nr:PIG-L family deacetylase [Aeromonas veronii]UBR46974.1 PIG-L family deacetylase [Aeromonas veronii]